MAMKSIRKRRSGTALPKSKSLGSPFVVGRPLWGNEPIFGRDQAFKFIGAQLAKHSSVNLVGERRMGKTSLFHHLLAHQSKYLAQSSNEGLVLVHIDLQGGVNSASRFYGTAMRELLLHPASDGSLKERERQSLTKRLKRKPEADYDDLESLLRHFFGGCPALRPVIILDEFEVMLESTSSFAYPTFYNGLRSLIGKKLLAMVIGSRLQLVEYFRNPALPGSLTSNFPNYFVEFELDRLNERAAADLLYQESDHPLIRREVREASDWAMGHPCHLQIVGESYYEAKAERYSQEWVYSRREKLKLQNCMVGPPPSPVTAQIAHDGPLEVLARWIRATARSIGRSKPEDVIGWMKVVGVVVFVSVIIVLLALGRLRVTELWEGVKQWGRK
jgi:hypothetical protein